ncbi:MAG: geranylgeranyl reductase, partial [Alphaproteobacteria bacterium]|nr:geranylgeranyl reductase [Alphaproteobacteria bacterium]
AAGLSNPVSGAGINAAVLSGNLAGEAVAAWLAGDRDALVDYGDELEALFGASIGRALRRRRAIMREYEKGSGPSPADLRAGWIAYPEYWADDEAAGKTLEIME